MTGTYIASFGLIDASSAAGDVEGVFAADGTPHSGSDVWHQVPVDQANTAVTAAGCGAGA